MKNNSNLELDIGIAYRNKVQIHVVEYLADYLIDWHLSQALKAESVVYPYKPTIHNTVNTQVREPNDCSVVWETSIWCQFIWLCARVSQVPLLMWWALLFVFDTDIDECVTNNGGCSAEASCSNMVGSFTCICLSGYTGDAFTCTGKSNCIFISAILETGFGWFQSREQSLLDLLLRIILILPLLFLILTIVPLLFLILPLLSFSGSFFFSFCTSPPPPSPQSALFLLLVLPSSFSCPSSPSVFSCSSFPAPHPPPFLLLPPQDTPVMDLPALVSLRYTYRLQ